MIGVPATMQEAVRGLARLRWRCPMNITALYALFGAQYAAMHLVDVPVPLSFPFTIALLTGFLVITKAKAFQNVVPRGTAAAFPMLAAIERGELKNAKESRIFDQHTFNRVPLRAFYCRELDVLIKQYDGWSALLDAPIGRSNHHWFVYFTGAVFVNQLLVAVNAWHFFADKFCDKVTGYSVLSLKTLWHLWWSAMPCREPTKDDSWFTFLVPSEHNHAAVWLVLVGGFMTGTFLMVLWRQFQTIALGITRMEKGDKRAPCSEGGVISIERPRPQISVYSEGHPIKNVALFLLGQFGTRWESVQAIPRPAAFA